MLIKTHDQLPAFCPLLSPLSLTHMSTWVLPSSSVAFRTVSVSPLKGHKRIQRSSNQIIIPPAANLHISNARSNFCHHGHSNNKIISADLVKDCK